MRYYKYLNPSRIDILERGFIRFTQPSEFNDPFEMTPHISDIATKEEIEEQFLNEYDGHIQAVYEELDESVRAKISFDLYKTEFVKNMLLDQVLSVAKGEALEKVKKSLGEAFSKSLGILCLTTKHDNLLMWAHYAESHTGFVLEFDGDNQFFKQVFDEPLSPTGIDEDLSKEYGYLKQVVYRDERPSVVVSGIKSFDSFLFKGKEWSYEDEWRMLMPASKVNLRETKGGVDLFLFELPSSAITKLILGYRSSPELLLNLQQIIGSNPNLSHIQIEKMSLHDREFKLIPEVL